MPGLESTLACYADMTRKLSALIDLDFPDGNLPTLLGADVERIHAAVADVFASRQTLAARLNRLMLLDDSVDGYIVPESQTHARWAQLPGEEE